MENEAQPKPQPQPTPQQNTPSLQSNPQIIYSWKAPMRAYIKRSPQIIRFYLALTFLLSLIVIFFSDFILLIPIWTVLFLFYVLTITPPPQVETKLTKFGIETGGQVIRWEALSHFYFGQRFSYEILTIVTEPPFFDHLYFVVPRMQVKQELIKILSRRLVYQEDPHKSITDRLIAWFLRLVPHEEENVVDQSRQKQDLSGVIERLSQKG